MRSIARNIAINAFTCFAASQILPGLSISGGFVTYLSVGILLTFLFMLLKPVLSIFTFPFTFISFGLSSLLVNAALLYILTLFTPQVQIDAFSFPGITFQGFTIPQIYFNVFFAYIIVAITLSVIKTAIDWLFEL